MNSAVAAEWARLYADELEEHGWTKDAAYYRHEAKRLASGPVPGLGSDADTGPLATAIVDHHGESRPALVGPDGNG